MCFHSHEPYTITKHSSPSKSHNPAERSSFALFVGPVFLEVAQKFQPLVVRSYQLIYDLAIRNTPIPASN